MYSNTIRRKWSIVLLTNSKISRSKYHEIILCLFYYGKQRFFYPKLLNFFISKNICFLRGSGLEKVHSPKPPKPALRLGQKHFSSVAMLKPALRLGQKHFTQYTKSPTIVLFQVTRYILSCPLFKTLYGLPTPILFLMFLLVFSFLYEIVNTNKR